MYILDLFLSLMAQTYKKNRYLRHIGVYFFRYVHHLSQKVLTLHFESN